MNEMPERLRDDSAPAASAGALDDATPAPRGRKARALAEVSVERKKDHILNAAEALFAEEGFAQVSIRDIADAAQANVAAVNYHFGSKEKLFEALFARRVIPVNQHRLDLLAAARARGRGGKPALRDVVEAFVRPPLLLGDPKSHGSQGVVMMRFLSRMLAMPKEHVFLEAYYGEVRSRFIATFAELLPRLSAETLLWRYNLMVGALIYALAGPQRMLRPPAAEPRTPRNWNVEDAIAEVVAFCTAGFEAAPRKK
ncbi:TetR/AcrR family transcriptional regulator [Ramlibacter albus]|uniref:TetR/AcrR family transcriptional regulator n=1 Tax=Ramlibacter albus TaxID=2079448 RepID=A0A923MBN9_9BURK|nr:TetR/AcrR family transcriptional regulator [Ramlibacter albus]MBC5767847.1 TetR/AcrR family transcriptional regulator [Ramlibacter albus]